MKRKIIAFIFAFLLLSSCSPKTLSNFVSVSAEALEQKIKDQESFVLYISSPSCPYCQETKENAFSYLKSHTEHVLFTIDVNALSASARQELSQTVYLLIGEAFYVASGLSSQRLYVPTTIRYEGGVAIHAKIGVIEEVEYSQWLS